ncbi:hypothetical protein GEMRC1_010277 [Eukaryota sp. GEM-RC1]
MPKQLSAVLSPFLKEFNSESIVQLFNEIDTDANLVDFNSEAASTFSTLATSIVTQIASQIEDDEKRAQNLSSFTSLLRLTKKLSAKAPDSVVEGFLANSNHTFVSFCEETIALCLTNLKHAVDSLEIVSVFVDVSLLVLELLVALAVNRSAKVVISNVFFPALLDLSINSFSSIEPSSDSDLFSFRHMISFLKQRLVELITVLVSGCAPARSKLIDWGVLNVKSLLSTLRTAPTFLHQAFIIELVLRAVIKKKDKFLSDADLNDIGLSTDNIEQLALVKSQSDMRRFLNDWNSSQGHKRKIFSFEIDQVSLDEAKLGAAFVDFGTFSFSLSSVTHESFEGQEKNLSISYENIRSLQISYRNNLIRISTQKKLSEDCLLYSAGNCTMFDTFYVPDENIEIVFKNVEELSLFKNAVGPVITSNQSKELLFYQSIHYFL